MAVTEPADRPAVAVERPSRTHFSFDVAISFVPALICLWTATAHLALGVAAFFAALAIHPIIVMCERVGETWAERARAGRQSIPGKFQRAPVLAAALIHLFGSAIVVAFFATQKISWMDAYVAGLALALSSGIFAVAAAHELLHRPDHLSRVVAKLVFALALYPHFTRVHVRVHHRHFGTAADIQTPHENEDVYAFVARATAGATIWAVRQRSTSWYNPLIVEIMTVVTIVAAVYLVAGLKGEVVLLVSAVTTVFITEAINFIQHRQIPQPAETLRGPIVCQDANPVTGVLMFNLSRHVDHHEAAGRTWCDLRVAETGATTSAGYWTLFWLAMIEPALYWFA